MRNLHAKTACDSRVYEYLLPSYTLMPRKPVDLSKFDVQPEQKFIELPAPTPEEMAQKRAYRISDDQLAHVQSILEAFVGTHNFHNYTIGRHYKDKASNRYIMSFKVKSPSTLIFSEIWSQAQINFTLFTLIIQVDRPQYVDNTEWLSLKVHGQSFMLHQIRKMVGKFRLRNI